MPSIRAARASISILTATTMIRRCRKKKDTHLYSGSRRMYIIMWCSCWLWESSWRYYTGVVYLR
jgi:hypothetical protein